MKAKEFAKLTTSIKQAGRIRRGRQRASRVFEFKPEDIKTIRRRLGKSQVEFALLIGVSPATLRNWEQGRRTPDGPARALLKVAAANPRAVALALAG
jgi:putative transcriptional regulator